MPAPAGTYGQRDVNERGAKRMKNHLNIEQYCGRGVPLSPLNHVLRDILRSRDYLLEDKEGLLYGKKGTTEVVFCLVDRQEQAVLDRFYAQTQGFAGKRVVASLVPFTEEMTRSLPEGVILWDREALEHEIGRTHLERVIGHRDPGLVDELTADDYPKLVSAEELSSISLIEVGDRIVRPRLEADDVKVIGAQTVGGFRFRLELVPHFLYRYNAVLYIDDHRLGEEQGRLAINALTKDSVEWAEGLELVHELDQSHQRLEPLIDQEEAKALAMETVLQRHTSERDFVRDSGSVTVTERKRASPRREEVELEEQGMFFLPVWCVEGVKGVMVLNASNGKVISEDYYSKDLS